MNMIRQQRKIINRLGVIERLEAILGLATLVSRLQWEAVADDEELTDEKGMAPLAPFKAPKFKAMERFKREEEEERRLALLRQQQQERLLMQQERLLELLPQQWEIH